jgi:hypothetical protein
MCTVLLPPGVNPTAVNKYITSSLLLPATYVPQLQPFWSFSCLSQTQERWRQGTCDCLQMKAVCFSGYRWLCCVCVCVCVCVCGGSVWGSRDTRWPRQPTAASASVLRGRTARRPQQMNTPVHTVIQAHTGGSFQPTGNSA